jgi:multidrug transporter EmrE-like cation transporter
VLLSLAFGVLLSFWAIAAMPLLTFHLPSLLMGIAYTLLGGVLTYGLLVWLLQGIKER